jgi:hypothetical protein
LGYATGDTALPAAHDAQLLTRLLLPMTSVPSVSSVSSLPSVLPESADIAGTAFRKAHFSPGLTQASIEITSDGGSDP